MSLVYYLRALSNSYVGAFAVDWYESRIIYLPFSRQEVSKRLWEDSIEFLIEKVISK